jgi:uncharacterized protein (TIGR02611 family)
MQKTKRHLKRTVIGIVGGLVVVIGIIAIPYPGPGWLIVFTGLAILATEFEWAQRILDKAKGEYDKWQDWLKRQPMTIRLLVLAFTCLVVLVTMWLLNVFGIVTDFLRIDIPWVNSPLPFFKN